jgi:hypothetical protein
MPPRFIRLALAALALAGAGLPAASCASGPKGPAFVVVEPNVYIPDRTLIRRISVLDDDQLIVEEAPSRYYLIKLFPACVSVADALSPVRIEERGIGIDRTTRFIVDGRTCPVRSIDRVERAPRTPAPASDQAPSGSGAEAPKQGGA